MISLQEIKQEAARWNIREDIIEKDYVLGWVLWGIALEGLLGDVRIRGTQYLIIDPMGERGSSYIIKYCVPIIRSGVLPKGRDSL